jgi:hypothetical protein
MKLYYATWPDDAAGILAYGFEDRAHEDEEGDSGKLSGEDGVLVWETPPTYADDPDLADWVRLEVESPLSEAELEPFRHKHSAIPKDVRERCWWVSAEMLNRGTVSLYAGDAHVELPAAEPRE